MAVEGRLRCWCFGGAVGHKSTSRPALVEVDEHRISVNERLVVALNGYTLTRLMRWL